MCIRDRAAACPTCEHLYQIDISSDSVCGWVALSNPAYRGLVLGSDWAAVYSFSTDWSGDVTADLLDSSADFDGWILTYSYVSDSYGIDIDITGQVAFDPLD